jgi:hypothetical protein
VVATALCLAVPLGAAHPQYLGSSLCITAVAVALHNAAHPGHDVLPLFWVVLYLLTGLAEEGLCHSVEPFAALEAGKSPFEDHTTRAVVAAEAVRLALMAPLVVLRWALCPLLAALYITACRAAQACGWRTAQAHALLTRLAARAALMLLGYSLQVDAPAAKPRGGSAPLVVVSNCLSYIDTLVLTAALGPLAVTAPAPQGGVAFVATLLGLAGVKAAVVVSFPEGRRTQGGCLLPFSPTATPVQPVGLRYSAANSFNASWVGKGHFNVWHAFQLTAAWMKDAQVFVLPPVTAASPEAAATKAQAMLSAALGWPVVKGALGDAAPATAAHTTGLASPKGRKAAGGSRPVSPLRSVSPPPSRRKAAKAA